MGRQKKFQYDSELYEGMDEAEVKDAVIRNLKQISRLKIELKTHVTSYSDTIKDLEARNDAALEALSFLDDEDDEPIHLNINSG